MVNNKNIVLACLGLLLITGCTGPSPSEIGQIGLCSSIGIVILSWPIIVFLTWLTRRKNLATDRKAWIQYLIFFVVSGIMFWFWYGRFTELTFVSILADPYRCLEDFSELFFVSILAVPYLLFFTLIFLFLSPRLLSYLPSFVLTPHFVISALLYATNLDGLEYLLPILFVIAFWFFTIPVGVVLFIGLLLRRRREVPGDTSKENNIDPRKEA